MDETTENAEPAQSPVRRVLARVRAIPRWVRVAAAVAVGVLALALVLDVSTASSQLCASCHEMAPRAAAWSRSGHASVPCVSCHQAPHPWYALPQRLYDRGRLLARDVASHYAGGFQDPVEVRSLRSDPVPDAVCLACHDPNRKATSGYRILIDHPEHAKRNGSCVSCHIRTAHPVGTRGEALTLMSQCFTCHGTARQPKASAECTVCHPAGYPLVPASHEATGWNGGRHGKIAKADIKQCEMCHDKAKCDSCHGLQMPHPMGWAKGATGHGPIAEKDRAVCEPCHGKQQYMCTMCHHDRFVPGKGTWVQQHAGDVRARGTAFCLECHSPIECVGCHKRSDEGEESGED